MDLQEKLQRMHKKEKKVSRSQDNYPDLSPFVGGQQVQGRGGSFWSITREFPACFVHGRHMLGGVASITGAEIGTWEQGTMGEFSTSDLVFLDTETTGLAGGTGTVAFLIGVGSWEEGVFRLRQFLMRDFPEEPPLLEQLAEYLADKKVLITFNGRSFDWPLLETRFTLSRLHRIIPGWKQHWDLLFWARRLWREKLPSCSLASLEKNVLGFFRQGDIPGAEIPQRYFDFLKSGRGELLQDICEHNTWDILSMVTLLLHLGSSHYLVPEKIECPQEALALGRMLENRKDKNNPEPFYLQAADCGQPRLQGTAWLRLGFWYKRQKDWEQAEKAWLKLLEMDQHPVLARVELAKIYEHRKKDWALALQLTRQALALAFQEDNSRAVDELEHRSRRLERKNKKRMLNREGISADNNGR